VSQNIADRTDAAEASTQETRGFMRQVRVAARHKYTPEEKVRMVLECCQSAIMGHLETEHMSMVSRGVSAL